MVDMIAPQILNLNQIEFIDNRGMLARMSVDSDYKYSAVRQIPFFRVDNFQRMMGKGIEIKEITLFDLDKLGFRLVSIKPTNSRAYRRTYKGQRKMFLLENKQSIIQGSIIIESIPSRHSIQIDMTNKRLRLKGKDSGYPHILSEGTSEWINL